MQDMLGMVVSLALLAWVHSTAKSTVSQHSWHAVAIHQGQKGDFPAIAPGFSFSDWPWSHKNGMQEGKGLGPSRELGILWARGRLRVFSSRVAQL